MLGLNNLALAGSLVAGIALGGTLATGWYEVLQLPKVVRETTEKVTTEQQFICEALTKAAADEAADEARNRQRAASEAAFDAYRKSITAREAERVRQIEELEQGIARYEDELEMQGRGCPLDSNDIEWLLNN